MEKLKLSILALLISFMGFGQDLPNETNRIISFGYGVYGARSTVIIEIEKRIISKSYNEIVKLVYSEDLKEKFIACIVCQKLQELNKIELNTEEKQMIDLVVNSTETLNFRNGCLCTETMSLQAYFQNGNPCSFKDEVNSILFSKIEQL